MLRVGQTAAVRRDDGVVAVLPRRVGEHRRPAEGVQFGRDERHDGEGQAEQADGRQLAAAARRGRPAGAVTPCGPGRCSTAPSAAGRAPCPGAPPVSPSGSGFAAMADDPERERRCHGRTTSARRTAGNWSGVASPAPATCGRCKSPRRRSCRPASAPRRPAPAPGTSSGIIVSE